MSIFADLKVEPIIQVNDKTRLDASLTFISKDEAAITKVEIEPEADSGFIDVFDSDSDNWFLDWAYATDGTKTVTVKITTDGSPVTLEKSISVITESTDNLLSNDGDLVVHEHDILKFLPAGKNSFKYMHRKAQELILDYLDKNNYRDSSGARLTKTALVQTEEYRQWSKYLTLHLIFMDLSNATDDVFMQKANSYRELMESARARIPLPIDLDGDGTVEDEEVINFASIRIRRD